MNRVAFIWEPEGESGRGAVLIKVDGRDLAEMIREVELPYASAEGHDNIAGSYVGLSPWQLRRSLTEHFMGADGSDLACGPEGKTVLLVCECGEPGCWPLMAEIDIDDRQVVWRRFEQPHRRNKWSYEGFGQLMFDRSEYEAALSHAETQLPGRP